MPLVYATPRARRQAERLLDGRCLENVVEGEIRAGNVIAGAAGSGEGSAALQEVHEPASGGFCVRLEV